MGLSEKFILITKPGSSLPHLLLSEENVLHNWFKALGSILNSNMSDAGF